MAALADTPAAPIRLSLGYSLAHQAPQAPLSQARILKDFGGVTNHMWALAAGYGFGDWNVRAMLGFGLSVRSQAGLQRPWVWGLGDLRISGGRSWILSRARQSSARALRLVADVGVLIPTGRYRQDDLVEASYLEPEPDTGVLKIRRIVAQTGLGTGAWAGLLSLSVGQAWHPKSRWAVMMQSNIPLAATRYGQRWGPEFQGRALIEWSELVPRVSIFAGPDFLFQGKERWSANSAPVNPGAQDLDLELASRKRLGVRAGASFRIQAGFRCGVEAVVGIWQSAEAGSLRETASGMAMCQWALGSARRNKEAAL